MRQPRTRLSFGYNFVRGKLRSLPFLLSFSLRRLVRQRSYSRDDGISPPPSVITLAVTDYCNLNCRMCPFQRSDIGKEHLDFALVKKLVDQLYTYRPYMSLCGRGEPFMHPQFFDIIRYIKSKGLWCAVDTNGTLIEKNVDRLIGSGIDLVNVSIDSVGEIHDDIRGVPGTFKRAVDGIRALKAKAPRFRPTVRINCVITGYSADHLTEVYELARELGVDMLNLSHSFYIRTEAMLKAQSKLCQNLPPAREKISWDTVDAQAGSIDYEKLAATISRLRSRDEGVIVTVIPDLSDSDRIRRYYSFKGFVEKRSARCAWRHSNIYPSGDVEMCDGVYPMGNLKQNDFLEIWNNEHFRELRKTLKKMKRFPICAACCRYYHYS